jgi:hypothetical protein
MRASYNILIISMHVVYSSCAQRRGVQMHLKNSLEVIAAGSVMLGGVILAYAIGIPMASWIFTGSIPPEFSVPFYRAAIISAVFLAVAGISWMLSKRI